MSVDKATTLPLSPAEGGTDSGEEIFAQGDKASDVEFKNAIQNTLDIIKDFYGANSSAVYWYNKDTKKFKLLAASTNGKDTYAERFDAGDDSISKLCRDKKSAIINLSKETGPEGSGLSLYKNPSKIRSLIACPVIIGDEVIAVVLCDSKAEMFFGAPNLETLYVFSESIAYYIKFFTLCEEYESAINKLRKLLNIYEQTKKTINVFDSDTNLFNAEFFDARLTSEINKNKVFNDRNVYCVYTGMDNLKSLQESGFDFSDLEKILINEFKEQFNGYDMIFKLSDNKYAIISSFSSEEKVFLEFEKIRKNISSKIYNLDGKDLNFTVTFVIKRIQDTEGTKQQYLEELDRMLELSRKEGGNLVKLA